MKPIGTHAYRPTADCIWNSFRSSGKRHLILTGARGAGKTTLLSKLFPKPLPGLTTWAEPGKAVYLKDNVSEECTQVGIYDGNLPGLENKMVLSNNGFAHLGIPALNACGDCDSEWISIDEIGYLEEQCEAYHESLRRLMDKKHLVAVVRKQELPFLSELCHREDVFLVDLDDPFGNIGCVIMASGLGKRFGGNKLMTDFHGAPLICRILDATEGIFARRVVVTRHEAVAALCEQRGIDAVLHDLPHRSDTVRLGLEAIEGIERCMFCTGDQPLLRRETMEALALASANDPNSIWRTAYEETVGSPVVFPGRTIPDLRNLPQGKGGGVIIQRNPGAVKTVQVSDLYELKDADTPADLELLLKR